tara:strand:+ start:107 stop:586 length:480 start_codon:yes stop_codon:yes gene_type:complete
MLIKKIFIVILIFLLFSCANLSSKKNEDIINSWKNASLNNLYTHSFFSNLFKTRFDERFHCTNGNLFLIDSNEIICRLTYWDFVLSEQCVKESPDCWGLPESNISTHNITTSKELCILACQVPDTFCWHDFFIKDDQILEYRPVGFCNLSDKNSLVIMD